MTQPDERFVVLSTAPDDDTAEEIAARLVAERLAACVNVLPGLRSYYWWNGAVQVDTEVQLLIKTDGVHLPALVEWLSEEHPYDCPEIVALPIAAGLSAYLEWIRDALEDSPGS